MNKKEKLMNSIDGLSGLDERLIAEAMEPRKKRRPYWAAAAAAALLAAGLAFTALKLSGADAPWQTAHVANETAGPGVTDAPFETAQTTEYIPSEGPAETVAPTPADIADPTEGPLVTDRPAETPQTTAKASPSSAVSNTPSPTDAPRATATPKATQTHTPTNTPKATATPKPTLTPKPTGKPTPTPSSQPTESSAPTDAPYLYEYESEAALLEAMRTGELKGKWSRYYRPADLPEGAALARIEVSNSMMTLNYRIGGQGWSLSWLRGEDPDEFIPRIASLAQGEWLGAIYLAQGTQAYFGQGGQTFLAGVPQGADASAITAFCRVERVDA